MAEIKQAFECGWEKSKGSGGEKKKKRRSFLFVIIGRRIIQNSCQCRST